MRMRNKHLKILTRVLIFTMFMTLLSPTVFAQETPSFELPVTVKLKGTPPTDKGRL